MHKFVFDTNTIVSAALFSLSIPRQALDKALERGVLFVSEPTSLELMTVLLRPKFDRYLQREKRELFLASLLQQVQFIEIVEKIHACRDAKDDKFLEVAVNGQVDALVTGDTDLLELHPYRSIPIIKPKVFLDHV
jgi:hypothetical protein